MPGAELQPAVWLIIMVCANQLVRSSGPSTVSTKSFCALIWSSQLIGGVSRRGADRGVLEHQLDVGLGDAGRRPSVTTPSWNSNQRPISSSRAMICATRLRSFSRARNAGCRRAGISACGQAEQDGESLMVAKVMVSPVYGRSLHRSGDRA